MSERSQSVVYRMLDHIFPKAPDFFRLLHEQALQVTHTVNLLVDFMGTGDAEIGRQIKRDEHEADNVKIQNIHTLNEAFSTQMDREDIYRAIMDLDEIVNNCKDCVNEMDALNISPDRYTYEMAAALRDGCQSLSAGFTQLGTLPSEAAVLADSARKSSRKVEKLYRKALAELFQGDDFLNMLKRREMYQHLDRAAERMAHCANTLHDIVVKIS
ncbi:MAG: DUF47 family protein [Betaproteobacteria bacterium]|nr:DUF47 family protein [Betaproteobacteria bacterium]